MMQKGEKRRFAILAAGVLLILSAAFLSPATPRGGSGMQAEGKNGASGAPGKDVMGETKEAQTKEEETADAQSKITQAMEFLMPLHTFLKAGNLAQAADFMMKNREEINVILDGAFCGERLLMDGKEITKEIDGCGMVLISSSTVFYGMFENGRPEGYMTALRSVVLGEPRYDYAIGKFENGRMNGAGTIGYMNYAETGGKDGLKTEKAGIFSGDMMEGEVRYTCIGAGGDSTTWHIISNGGITQIDKRWKYDADKGEYSLLAENDRSHAYILKEKDALNEIWKNRIVW